MNIENEARAVSFDVIRALQIEAGAAGDTEMVNLCKSAIEGDKKAAGVVLEVVLEREAQEV